LAAPVTIRSSCSTSSATWSVVSYSPATPTAPRTGAWCWRSICSFARDGIYRKLLARAKKTRERGASISGTTAQWRKEARMNAAAKGVGVAVALLTASQAWSQELKFTTQDFRPFNYEIDGVVSGPAADIIVKVCAEMQISCTFDLLPWPRAQQEVRNGQANGMFVVGWNKKRAEWVHFTPPIMNTEYGIFVRKDNPLKYNDLSDIQGYTVGVYGPSNTSNSLEQIRDEMKEKGLDPITIDMRPDDESGFKKLGLGRLDAVCSNRDVGYALIAKLGLQDNVRYAGATKKLKYYIGFSKEHNDPDILQRFDDALLKLYKQGVLHAILDQYGMGSVAIE
jgi:polar amino acid transport system substrate-binding protein